MTLIYLIRHGETAWNQENIFRGRKDIPLSEKGRQEAQALATALAPEPIKFIYTSPLSRARETAQPLADRLSLPVQIHDGLIDLDFGDWEGKPLKEIEQSAPDLFRLWKLSPDKVRFPGGESLGLARDRAMAALVEIAKARPQAAVAVVSHRVICKLLVLAALNAPESAFWCIQQDLACYNILEWTGQGWIVRLVNETAHLKDIAGHLNKDF